MVEEGWHLDKRVPIALVLAIVVQTGGMVWWASSLSERVRHLENQTLSTADQSTRLVRVETQIEALNNGLQRIERKLDRVLDSANP